MYTCPALKDTPAMRKSSGRDQWVIALAGQPNVGKSTVFNLLTGLNQHVGNWPGKTIEQKIGTFTRDGECYTLVDLPGTYSLTANSEEERITRDYILRERPDLVIAVVDAAVLERNLYLLTELLLLPAPVILALNMMDVAAQEGIQVEPKVLEAALGLPVVPMSASKNVGVRELVETVTRFIAGDLPYAPHTPTILPNHQAVLEEIHRLLGDHTPHPYPAEWVALKLLEGDEELHRIMQAQLPPQDWEAVHAQLYAHEDAILDIAGARYEWITRMVRAAVIRPRVGQVGLTSRLDRVLTHPAWGTLALLGILGVVFWLTYTVGAPLQEWLDTVLGDFAAWVGATLLSTAPAWLAALVSDGILGGAVMVMTFVPILVIFFAVLGFLEDTGYLARAAYITDRFMHLLGLHGKSFMPLLLGFGCNVPAIMGARIIETRRARLLTSLLAPFVPCAGRMVVVTLLAGLFFGRAATLVALGLVGLNLLLLAGFGIVLNRLLLPGEPAAFIMELPLYHLPNPRTIGLYVWRNVIAFIQKAGTIILVAAVVIWALSYFPADGDIAASYLGQVGQALEPVGRWMGLPWPVLIALLTSFVAKENTLAALGVLYADMLHELPLLLSPAAALAFIVAQMLFIPCVATVATLKQETGSWKWTLFSLAVMTALTLIIGVAIYQLGALVGLG